MRVFAHKLRNTEGAEIAEAALVLPVVFVFLLGIIWFGRAFNIYSTIQQAAQQGAIVAARATCGTCGSSGGNQFPTGTTVAGAVTSVMQASSLDPNQILLFPASTPATCAAPTNNITVCQQVLLNPPPSSTQIQSCGSPPDPTPSQICGSMVTFQYPFQFYLPFTSLNLSQVILTAQAQSRMEN